MSHNGMTTAQAQEYGAWLATQPKNKPLPSNVEIRATVNTLFDDIETLIRAKLDAGWDTFNPAHHQPYLDRIAETRELLMRALPCMTPEAIARIPKMPTDEEIEAINVQKPDAYAKVDRHQWAERSDEWPENQ